MKSKFYVKINKDERTTLYIDPSDIQMFVMEISEFSNEQNRIIKFSLTLNISPHYIEAYVQERNYRNHEAWLCSQSFRDVNRQSSVELEGWPIIKKVLQKLEGKLHES